MEISLRILIMALALVYFQASAAVIHSRDGLYDPQSVHWSADTALQHKATIKAPFTEHKQVLEKRSKTPKKLITTPEYERGRDEIHRHIMKEAYRLGELHWRLESDSPLPDEFIRHKQTSELRLHTHANGNAGKGLDRAGLNAHVTFNIIPQLERAFRQGQIGTKLVIP